MRRLIGPRDFLHVETRTLAAGDDATIPTPLSCMFRVKCTAVATGATLLYRGQKEAVGGIGDSAEAPHLVSLGVTGYEALWVFCRGKGILDDLPVIRADCPDYFT